MYTKVLVPLDGSRFSQCSLDHVRTIALGLNVPEVVVLRVVEPLPDDVRNGLAELGDERIPQLEKKRKAEALDYVTTITKMLGEEGIHARKEVLQGKAAEEIIGYAQKHNFDLVIMSTHGRSGASHWATGTVAGRVADYSAVPVQLVSSKECRTSAGF